MSHMEFKVSSSGKLKSSISIRIKRTDEEKMDLSKGGFIVKKGLDIFFVIKNHVLYWFVNERVYFFF